MCVCVVAVSDRYCIVDDDIAIQLYDGQVGEHRSTAERRYFVEFTDHTVSEHLTVRQ